MKADLQNYTFNMLNTSCNFPSNSGQLQNSPNCLCISALCIMPSIYNVCSILGWVGILSAASEGHLLLSANFQGRGFSSFFFFIPTEKHFWKCLCYCKSVVGVLPGCKRQLNFLHWLIQFLCLLVGLHEQCLDLEAKDCAIHNHAIQLNKQSNNSSAK